MTVSGSQPDSPVGEWQAVFVGDATLNRRVAAPDGEHFPPAHLDGHRLSAANEATRVATYSPVGGDGVETVAGSAAAGLTEGSERDRTPGGRVGDLSAVLVRLLLDATTMMRPSDAHLAAGVLLASGWRPVSEDDDTVERVAIALYADRQRISVEDARKLWGTLGTYVREHGRRQGRAAVQALRDGSGTDEHCQGCGGPLSDGGHGMSEFGGCV